ncbi:MAG: hypothetical protein R3F65_20620 [bacterium]|nr:hypothetical protein [Myxococcales bacterium]MCB9550774.1 hypothetical protein [Myxococcales bacterium]
MARIILTLAGPWDKPPALRTPFSLSEGPPDPTLIDDFRALAAETDGLDEAQLAAIAKHTMLITAEHAFEGPGKLDAAAAAAKLMHDAFAAGALGVRVETGLKVFGPGVTEGLDLREPAVLLHLLVEVVVDDEVVATEGMQAFDLPDVQVRYDEEDGPAQAAAFALAARMACDRFRPVDGGVFRASESAPLYAVQRVEPVAEPGPFDNPRGAWRLGLKAG